jgi:hypothetical protein
MKPGEWKFGEWETAMTPLCPYCEL